MVVRFAKLVEAWAKVLVLSEVPDEPLPPGPYTVVVEAMQYLCDGHADELLPRAEWESAPWLYWPDPRDWPDRCSPWPTSS